jgi:predicted aldo/keto reductase-like oxidoreductase
MTDPHEFSRRHLLTLSAGASVAATLGAAGQAYAAAPQVPRRVLGKTKESIPILLLGGGAGFRGGTDPIIKKALEHGVNYVDTARKYAGGSSERNSGSTLRKLKARDKTWITSKTPQWSAPGLKQDVAMTLANMKTSWVDLYFLHGLDQLGPLNDKELIKATEQLKKEKKIRFFGFSCHGGNVAELLHAAAKRPFIDAVMFRYSFRDYGNKELNHAIDAAHQAGVGLIAMKTQGSEAGFRDAWKKYEKTGKWNKHQAVLKAVWADKRISAAVSHMQSLSQLKENMAAAMDRQSLSQAENEALKRYAELTRGYACQGCDHICAPHVQADVNIGTTLRSLMYKDTYADYEKARRVFHELPEQARRFARVDFSDASHACPQGIDIAAHMQRAAKLFA